LAVYHSSFGVDFPGKLLNGFDVAHFGPQLCHSFFLLGFLTLLYLQQGQSPPTQPIYPIPIGISRKNLSFCQIKNTIITIINNLMFYGHCRRRGKRMARKKEGAMLDDKVKALLGEKKLKVNMGVTIDPDLLERLKALAERNDVKLSQLVEAILQDFMEKGE
jgi:hypothetical protein